MKLIYREVHNSPLGDGGKKLQACKPDSVPDSYREAIIYLRCSLLTTCFCLPIPKHQLMMVNEQLTLFCCWIKIQQWPIRDLCGISACKVYPQIMLPLNAVSSYLTFSSSPFPSTRGEREKAVIFCGTFSSLTFTVREPAVNRCIALSCPDFPFRPKRRNDSLACSTAKLILISFL